MLSTERVEEYRISHVAFTCTEEGGSYDVPGACRRNATHTRGERRCTIDRGAT